ncbi:hypothetical protein FRUB_02535 [Fimbriiglobus ruber]|uniref:Uncharacterized protein n=1 Tax=Fimbriiglobus ruber TaxID=1908690 RepID=A0A225DYX3_9BACT|nr:hypothetical protein FRUB_02535 [Fimbriiglobus ruber]
MVIASVGYDKMNFASFIIVPRSAVGAYPTALSLAEAVVEKKVKGAVVFPLEGREEVPEWHSPELTIDYQLQRKTNRGDAPIELVRTT